MGILMDWKLQTATLKIHGCRFENFTMFGFIQKQYSENFAFLILTILELFIREVCVFLNK